MRARRLTALLVASLAAGCSGARGDGSGASPSGGPRVESLEAVDVSQLSRAERRVWVELVNDLLSPCGEPMSVGRCVAEERACSRCVPAARYLVRLIAEGYERHEIEEHYASRFGRDRMVELSTETAPARGSPVAQVTIVEFSDFECPYCGRAHPILQQVLSEFEGRVRLVFRHYPLTTTHPHAMAAARAAVAAGAQGKFWEMHDLLFQHQQQLEEDDLMTYAEQLRLDMERFRNDFASRETQRIIDRDKEEGRRAGVDSTPTFFVNGRRLQEPPSALTAYLREELDE